MVWCRHCMKPREAERDPDGGFLCCTTCGRVIDNDIFANDPVFFKNAGGQSQLSGNFVKTIQSDYSESRDRTLMKGREEISIMVSSLSVGGGDSIISQAFAFYQIAVERNFTRGRRTSQVAAACLYIACRLGRGVPNQDEQLVGIRCHVERRTGENRVVVDLDAAAFKEWDVAIVCSIGGPEVRDDWEEVAKIIIQLIPEERNFTLHPFDDHHAILHSNLSSVGECALIHRITQTSLAYFERNPFHLWILSVLSSIGDICGGLVEVHPLTSSMFDRSAVGLMAT
ncbi:hypothetical protein HHK36_019479 [Tetracentron sinense]|uniref:Transcription factor TFIIB cyclin-like domain-containing protein n=1 Tax=Tetracentron sinense TaxID=13715 RepID=A0A834YZ96_TETSI|nr:hypothetical protein HHK36_019479 [Tetracentron sinense]